VLVLAGVAVWVVLRAARNFGATNPFAGFLLLPVPVGMLTLLIWAT